jgi:hypothetical protein
MELVPSKEGEGLGLEWFGAPTVSFNLKSTFSILECPTTLYSGEKENQITFRSITGGMNKAVNQTQPPPPAGRP